MSHDVCVCCDGLVSHVRSSSCPLQTHLQPCTGSHVIVRNRCLNHTSEDQRSESSNVPRTFRVTGLAHGSNDEITLLTMRFDLATLQSRAQNPNPKGHTVHHYISPKKLDSLCIFSIIPSLDTLFNSYSWEGQRYLASVLLHMLLCPLAFSCWLNSQIGWNLVSLCDPFPEYLCIL